MSAEHLTCDGCGQGASPEHIALRLKRLEWATRWRPIHIGTLLLGAAAPQKDAEFLYAGRFEGEAADALKAAGLSTAGKEAAAVLAEFQRNGYFLAHVLECAANGELTQEVAREALLERRIPIVAARIRRSLRPKRVLLISELPSEVLQRLASSELGCPIFRRDGTTLTSGATGSAVTAAQPF